MGIYTRPDSPWYWLRLEGTRVRESTGIPIAGGSDAQDKELRRQAIDIYARRKAEAVLVGVKAVRPTISYRALSTWYETHEAAHHRGVTKERSMLKTLGASFGHVTSVADLDEAAVKEWMTTRRRAVAVSTVNRELDVLKLVLRSAVPKYLAVSPIAGLRRFRSPEAEARVLTADEETRLLAVADLEERAWLVVALDTLMRLANVVHLKWPQVKLGARVIVPLNAKVSYDAVPITARMAEALAALPPTDGAGWVFPSFHRRGTGATAPKNKITRAFDQLCQRARVPHGRAVDGVTFHSLRHTGATRALQGGASVRTVMKLGGWQDERSVMRYVHAADSDVRAAAESISRAVTSRTRANPSPKRA